MKSLGRPILPLAFVCLLLSAGLSLQEGEIVVDPQLHHLGDDETPDWPDVPPEPEGGRLEVRFDARANPEEWTLFFRQRHVDDPWTVSLNGHALAELRRTPEARDEVLAIPAGVLVDGANTFSLDGAVPTDDIVFGAIRIVPRPLRAALRLRPVVVRVTDGGRPSPARVTVVDGAGERVPVWFAEELHQATRDGVVYTDAGEARFELPEGEYRVFATRGPEWSLAETSLVVAEGEVALDLDIERVVDTTGFVACDTHVHTLTFSGHGDSSVEERMVTLAGEGVELAIATDHNHNTDYVPYQERMGLNEHFTPVVGNEVTTPIGHFNAFPLDPADEVPPYEVHDVVQLVDGIRAKGAQVVILNHPRWPSHEKGPFGVIELDHFTGANNGPWTYPFDAVEVINSCTEEEEPMLLFRDWFALLNRGEGVSAVASSDSHTVGDPVGGGRTYVASTTDDPAAIDVDAACAAIVQGCTSLSMGIFVDAEVRIDGTEAAYRMGSQANVPRAGTCTVRARIQAPEWIRPRRATLFLNGQAYHEVELDGPAVVATSLARAPRHDAWAVWVVVGDGVDGAYWPLHNDYTLGATNPIFLDLDGDGTYRSPLETATRLVAAAGDDVSALATGLEGTWEAVAMHALDRVRIELETGAREHLRAVGEALRPAHGRVGEYLEGLPEVR